MTIAVDLGRKAAKQTNMSYAPVKFDVASSDSLEDVFTRKKIIYLTLTLG